MKSRITAISLTLVFITGCSSGLIKTFRIGLSVAPPFVASLVAEGVITQAVASIVTADISDLINAAVNGDRCLKAITVTNGAKQAAKAKCYLALAVNLRSILSRHNIGGVDRLSSIARIIEAGIAAFEEYSRDISGEGSADIASRAGSISTGEDPDEKLKRSIQQFKKDLREATKSTDKSGKIRYLIPRDSDFLVAR